LFAAVLAVQATDTGWAQDSDRSERYFNELDRNNNGELDGDEFRRMDSRMRDRFRDRGVDGDRSVSKSRFMDTYRRIDEDRRREDDERRRSSGDSRSSSSSGSSSSSSRSRSRQKPKLTATLPAKYLDFDKNKDDQIGMYEWDKAKFAEFMALDRNRDGFLTPNELDDPPKPTAVAATTAKPAPSGSPTASATDKPATDDNPDTRQAKYFFSLTDKNKNGEISAEEWTASSGIRKMFEKANVAPAMPLKEADFVTHYVAVKQKK
jgi:Ca2+-binding EF-hand superfamily protein